MKQSYQECQKEQSQEEINSLLQEEIVRLSTENEDLRSRLHILGSDAYETCNDLEDSAVRLIQVEKQRDELADALESWHEPWEGITLQGDNALSPYAGYYIRNDDGQTHVYVSIREWEKVQQTRTALRKVGRLPK